MELTPIKLLKDTALRRSLLKIKKEKDEIDQSDYMESLMVVSRRARTMMAIEDASEIAKHYLQRNRLFERIAKDIAKESGAKFAFRYRKTKNMVRENSTCPLEFVLMEHTYESGEGHYGMLAIRGGGALIYDSMGEGQDTFKNPVALSYSKKNIRSGSVLGKFNTRSRDATGVPFDPQSTGGFIPSSVNDNMFNTLANYKRKKAFELTQFDELSQHHFCYVEAFIAMMKELGMTDGGPPDPRDRLEYIKKVVWGLILKYSTKAMRSTNKWKYMETNFKYIIKTSDAKGKKLKLIKGTLQDPGSGKVSYKIKKINLPEKVKTFRDIFLYQ